MSLELINLVIEAIEKNKCLPFLGAGASAGYSTAGYLVGGKTVPGIPLGGELAEKVAKDCRYRNGSTYNLPLVAEYHVHRGSGNPDGLHKLIQTELAAIREPRPIHTVLAQLHQIQFAITTNYDRLFERALEDCGRIVSACTYDLHSPTAARWDCEPSAGSPEIALYKMHGSMDQPNTMVVTQSDYIRCLAYLNDPERGMPEVFRLTIPRKTLLFLGYGLEDWNFLAIWEGVLARHHANGTALKAYAVLQAPKDAAKAEFQRSFCSARRIELIYEDLTAFAATLAQRFKLDVPQLGIRQGVAEPAGGASA